MCGLPGLGELSAEFERLSEGWSVVRNLFLRGSRTSPCQVLPRAHARLVDLAARERVALEELGALIGELPG